jgi:hypothetical protein
MKLRLPGRFTSDAKGRGSQQRGGGSGSSKKAVKGTGLAVGKGPSRRPPLAPEPVPAAAATTEPEPAAPASIEIPAKALLAGLQEELRGPQWNADEFPALSLTFPRVMLLQQLRRGRIMVQLRQVLDQVPEGWVADEPAAFVSLDMATVVQALPRDVFAKGQTEEAEAAGKGGGGAGYVFKLQPVTRPGDESDEGFTELPLAVLLSRLPEDLRGPQWHASSFPEGTFRIRTGDLVKQLRTGRVSVTLAELLSELPPGWVADVSEAEPVVLELATVVNKLGPEFLAEHM